MQDEEWDLWDTWDPALAYKSYVSHRSYPWHDRTCPSPINTTYPRYGIAHPRYGIVSGP